MKAYIESHLSDELDRDTLAAMVYLNADYLSHLFKKDTGSSLINYIIDRRIAHSKELLAKGEMSIRDIAITCGFQNISYFSRQFKKSTGMTPRSLKIKNPVFLLHIGKPDFLESLTFFYQP